MENYPNEKTILLTDIRDNFDFNLFYGNLNVYPPNEIE